MRVLHKYFDTTRRWIVKINFWEKSVIGQKRFNPYRVLALSFLGVILLGTGLLLLPFSTQEGAQTTLVDAFFTAASCVSVTGLAVVDTYHHWTLLGRLVMVFLIQIGGLGTMTLTSLIFLVLGKKIGLQNRLLAQEGLGEMSRGDFKTVVRQIAKLTVFVELMGGLIYVFQLYPYIGPSAYYIGFFQAISSFCNAGFVFFDNSLPYVMATDWIFTINTCVLIIIGGFGYFALFDIWHNWGRGFATLALHTKVMLVGQLSLISIGTLLIMLLECSNEATLGQFGIVDKFQVALFQAVTPRTAGLATLDFGEMHPFTLFLTIIFMFIGAGPNSTAGGVKISTIAVLLATSYSIFSLRPKVELFGRSLGMTQISRACGIVFFSSILIAVGSFTLSYLEHFSFLEILFEVTSAFGTVGLSCGITPYLSEGSKWMLILVMYTGRIGILTLLGSFLLRGKAVKPIQYPEEHVIL